MPHTETAARRGTPTAAGTPTAENGGTPDTHGLTPADAHRGTHPATHTAESYEAVMRGVIPYVSLGGRAGEAADFYGRAFGAGDLGRVPIPHAPERYMHVQVEINGGVLMMTDHDCEGYESGMRNVHMQLVVGDGRGWWDRAVAAGCRVVAPYEMQFWGDEWGLLEDPFGIQWAILEPGPDRGATQAGQCAEAE